MSLRYHPHPNLAPVESFLIRLRCMGIISFDVSNRINTLSFSPGRFQAWQSCGRVAWRDMKLPFQTLPAGRLRKESSFRWGLFCGREQVLWGQPAKSYHDYTARAMDRSGAVLSRSWSSIPTPHPTSQSMHRTLPHSRSWSCNKSSEELMIEIFMACTIS